MKTVAAAARFALASGAVWALAWALPALVLGGPSWIAWLVLAGGGVADLGAPVIEGARMTFARHALPPLVLEDPYVLAGIPLLAGLGAAPARALRAVPWLRLAGGVLLLEVFAGVVLALVGACVVHGYTVSPPREPLEVVALAAVALARVLPIVLWFALDPAARSLVPSARRRV